MSRSSARRNWRAGGAAWWAVGAFIGMALLAVAGSAAGRADEGSSPASKGAPAAELIGSGSCGAPGQSPCPLQAYMRASIATPLASNDTEALAAALERARRFAPDPSWTSWASFAAEGAAAARARDIAKARASCKGCHEAWRERYRSSYRPKPLPR